MYRGGVCSSLSPSTAQEVNVINYELQVFTSERFGKIRTTDKNGTPLFVGRDVAIALGYANPLDAIRDHVDAEDKMIAKCDTPGGAQDMVVINESGLYSLILASKLQAAKQFKHWITSDVLPAIRQHGAYFTTQLLQRIQADPAQAQLLVMEYVHSLKENDRLQQEIQIALPKVKYYDVFVNPSEGTSIRNVAKELEIPERLFVLYLLIHHYLYRTPSGKLMPYARYVKEGLFIVRDFDKRTTSERGQYTLITARGKEYFMLRREMILEEIKEIEEAVRTEKAEKAKKTEETVESEET